MKKIEKIIIGTHNQGKFREIADLLPNSIKKISPKQLKIPSPKETGKTFRANSNLKAIFFSKKTNLVSISDDSGLEIDLLKGLPGIYSARWAGNKNNFNFAIKKVFNKLSSIDPNWKNKKIKARFICCLTIYWPTGKIITKLGIVKGKISNSKKGKNGFGYDPIFIPEGYNKTFGQMKLKFKYRIDHRSIAFKKIKKLFFN
jgi:XTP/dITP diphosphohydrolase